MTTIPVIDQAQASGRDIYKIVKQIEPSLIGVPRHEAIMAMLSMVIILMEPEIDDVNLAKGVKDVSEFICLMVAGQGDAENSSVIVMN